MNSPARDSASQANAWLVEGAKPKSGKDTAAEAAGDDALAEVAAVKETPTDEKAAELSEWIASAPAVERPAEPPKPAEPERSPAEPGPNGSEQEQKAPPPEPPPEAPPPELPPAETVPSGEEKALRRRVEKLEGELEKSRSELATAKSELATASEARGSKARDSKQLEKAQQTIKEHKEERADLARRIRELQTDLRREAKRVDAEVKRAVTEVKKDVAEERAELERELSERSQEREAKLTSDFAARESELNETIATLTGQLETLKEELVQAKKAKPRATRRRTTATTAKRSAKPPARPAAKRRAAGSRSNGELDVNEATFEELRNLGLSVTQSARLIAYRDVRGGYKSLDELDDIPGLSEATKKDLRGQLTLGR